MIEFSHSFINKKLYPYMIKVNGLIYIGQYLQLMPVIKCIKCGRLFWAIPFIDKGFCPKCQK